MNPDKKIYIHMRFQKCPYSCGHGLSGQGKFFKAHASPWQRDKSRDKSRDKPIKRCVFVGGEGEGGQALLQGQETSRAKQAWKFEQFVKVCITSRQYGLSSKERKLSVISECLLYFFPPLIKGKLVNESLIVNC